MPGGGRGGEREATQYLALTTGPLLFEERSPRVDLPEGARLAGPVHFAFCVPRAGLDAVLERAADAGVEVRGPLDMEWMGAESRYLYDPDGNLAELWTPVDGVTDV